MRVEVKIRAIYLIPKALSIQILFLGDVIRAVQV